MFDGNVNQFRNLIVYIVICCMHVCTVCIHGYEYISTEISLLTYKRVIIINTLLHTYIQSNYSQPLYKNSGHIEYVATTTATTYSDSLSMGSRSDPTQIRGLLRIFAVEGVRGRLRTLQKLDIILQFQIKYI
jgi:hypothetical protein